MADEDISLDEYGDWQLDAAGDVATASDDESLVQDIRHRLLTPKGGNPADAEYGAGVQLWLHRENTPGNRAALINNCQSELAKENRILPQRTIITIETWTRDKILLRISFVKKNNEAGEAEVETE